jgi:hypothetical protein
VLLKESNLEKLSKECLEKLSKEGPAPSYLCGELLELKSGVLGTESSKLNALFFWKKPPACGDSVLIGSRPKFGAPVLIGFRPKSPPPKK